MLYAVPVLTRRLSCSCLALALTGLSSTAGAHFSVSVSTQWDKLALAEVSEDGESLNREIGMVPVHGLQVSYRKPEGLYWEASTLMGSGVVYYTGLSQAGPTRLFASETEYYFNQLQLQVGRSFRQSTFYGGVGHRYRERNIRRQESVRGLYEEFEHNYVLVGLDYLLLQDSRSHVRVDAQLRSSFSSSLQVEFDGLYDPASGSTGSDFTFHVSMEWFAESEAGWGIAIAPMYEYKELSRSRAFSLTQNGTEVGTFQQPNSQWETFSIRLRINRRF